ncbi:alpha/beta hydrolase [Phenylobacterium sp.]|uniref:alpha/beta hydrolase n=1 Tax=Phenylobacterium sp. TaxID=1871053 RepID=UPI0027301219|nr:alpha/beta fold hydrolase [Phenylobacterium sp.]MDP1601028.1 alpha/beta fold hydrolase [Phenylobacterium sp.]MDP3595330.1 alpha/beta fold hydrolase [Phenylobacterium sp.]
MGHEIEQKSITIWSEGSRLAAEILRPKGGAAALPAIVLAHGWGGLKEHLIELYGRAFAAEGFVVLAFDYRGWGGSDGRMIAATDTPMLTEGGVQTQHMRVLREVVDPVDQLADVRNCFAWLVAEQGVDPARVGLWGSSYGGGHVTCAAGMDPRVKAVVAQIGGYGHPREEWYSALALQRQSDKARGVLNPPVPQGVDGAPGLRGTPDIARQLGHAPLDYAQKIRAPILFIDAEFEEYNAPALQGGAAFEIVKANGVTTERRTFPCTHYKVYDEHLVEARQMALDWFKKHL